MLPGSIMEFVCVPVVLDKRSMNFSPRRREAAPTTALRRVNRQLISGMSVVMAPNVGGIVQLNGYHRPHTLLATSFSSGVFLSSGDVREAETRGHDLLLDASLPCPSPSSTSWYQSVPGPPFDLP